MRSKNTTKVTTVKSDVISEAWGFPDDKRKKLELILVNSNLSKAQKDEITKLAYDVYISGLNFKSERPPIGLTPKQFTDEKGKKRLASVKAAIGRYVKANRPISIEWIKEYNEFCEKKKS